MPKKTGKNILGFTPEAMRLMVAYPWPGNIRELRNTVEYAFVLARGKSIGPEHLPDKITRCKLMDINPVQYAELNNMVKLGFTEKEKLIDALQQSDGNQTKAAKIIGVSRVTVWKRIKKYGIQIQ